MTPDTISLLRASFALAAADPAELLRMFQLRLGQRAPGVRMLLPTVLTRDAGRFVALIDQALRRLERRDLLVEGLQMLGRLQAGYAALPTHYPEIGLAFREALAIRLGRVWSPVTDASWREFEVLVTRIMGAAHWAEYQRLTTV